MKRKLILVLLFVNTGLLKAQDGDIWYFGLNAGISFQPTGAISPVALNNSVMNAPEGSAVACDSLGRLFFYTNGETIYNRNHAVMQDGYDIAGHYSSFQSSLIVQAPNSHHLYYVFVTDANENNFARGYSYCIVDMDAANGNGAVVVKNIRLHAPGSERLTAVRHKNSIDAWIITNDFNSNIFRTWLLTCNGLSAIPVISTAGEVMNGDQYMNIGALKASLDGRILCQTHFPDLGKSENFFQLFDFDNATGMISHPMKIVSPNTLYFSAEFSPDSKLLYVSKGSTKDEIDQFEITGNAAAISSSRVILPAAKGIFGLQLGPDDKIYAATSETKLGVISYPNFKGLACQMELDKIDLGDRSVGINFPSHINDYAVKNFTYSIVDSCRGIVQFNGINSLGDNIAAHWDFGDGSFSNQLNPLHAFTGPPKLYQVVLTLTSVGTCGFISRTQFITQGGIVAIAGFDYKQECDSGLVRFTNTSLLFPDSAGRFEWKFADVDTSTQRNPVYRYDKSGLLSVKLKIVTAIACRNDSIAQTVPIHTLKIKAIADQVIQEGETITLYTNGGAGANFTWAPAEWLNDASVPAPRATPPQDITYIVTAKDQYACTATDTVSIKVLDLDGLYVPTAFTPNGDALNDILRPILGLNYTLVSFSIFNRWGEKVFETHEKQRGWNGIYGGLPQAADGYVWMLTVTGLAGDEIRRKGSFVLIR